MKFPIKKAIISILVFLTTSGFSQTDVDALRFSQTNFGGTARGMATAGAFGGLGGDHTSITLNPAGLGVYRSGEFVITPALLTTKNQAAFLGNNSKEFKYAFNFSSLGVSGAYETSGSNWKWINWAVGYNRINDFHRSIFFHGYNGNNSIIDRYAELAKGVNPNELSSTYPFNAGLAYETYLINPSLPDSTIYESIVPNGNINQLQNTETKGKIDEWYIAAGTNYKDKIYFGATLGIPILRYKEETTFEEDDFNDSIINFKSFSVTNNLETRGEGLNLKLGMIYRLNDYVRIGGAVHTPTYYWLEDKYSSYMVSDLDTFGDFDWSSPEGNYQYKLQTPFRLIGSIAILSKKLGFISFDYEWLDYGQSFFDFDTKTPKENIIQSGINETIEQKYQPTSNIRIGAEGKMGIYRIRGGYAIYGSPIHPDIVTEGGDLEKTSITFGLGVREKEYFIDVAYVRTTTKDYFSPYDLASSATPGVVSDITQNNILVSVGLKF